MARVTGLGGVFFKSQDPDKLRTWYADHLGIKPDEHGSLPLNWRDMEKPEQIGRTMLMPFPPDTSYFEPSRAPFMLNFQVENLDEDSGLTAAWVRLGSPDLR